MYGEINRIARTPLEFAFGSDEKSQLAQQVAKELEGKSNLLMDAVYMPTNEDTRHRIRRDESFNDTAITVASDQGHPYSEGGHENETTFELGLVADGCMFDSIQEDNSDAADVALMNRKDCEAKTEAVNRKDAWMTVYGNQNTDPKGWNGLSYYTRKITNRTNFETAYYAGKNPFEGEDLCLTLDNQSGATTAINSTNKGLNIFSSIYAVVWDPKYVAKLYSKKSSTYGIDVTMSPETVVEVTDASGNKFWHTKRMYAVRKGSGLCVADRFGLIRVANICMDATIGTGGTQQTGRDLVEEYERLCKNMAFVEELLDKKGLTNKVKFYAPVPLLRKMREARALASPVSQSNIFYSIPGVEQAGQIHGIMAKEFYLNDNYLVTPEFQMVHTESFVS